MVSIQDYGIDRLPEDQRLLLARQILESVSSQQAEMSDEELDAEAARRDAELDANPELALTEEQFWAQLERGRE
jgi:putative addiction module component (TIGR02574 family)